MAGKFRHMCAFLWHRALCSGPLCALSFAFGGLCAALILFLACFWLRLQFGPVSLGPSVSMVSGALSHALPEGISVSYGQAALEWSREDDRVHIAIFDIRMSDSDGKSFVSAPKADIDLAAAPLLRGQAEVHRIALIGVKMTLVRTKAGQLRFGIGKNRIEQDIVDQFVRKLSSAKGGSALKALAVRGAQLTYYDAPTDLKITSNKANIHLGRESHSSNLQVVLNAALSVAGRPADVHVSAGFPMNAATDQGLLEIHGLDLAGILARSHKGLVADSSHLRSDTKASFSLAHGKLQRAKFTLTAKGALQVPALQQTFAVRDVRLRGSYDGKTDRLQLSDAQIRAHGISGDMQGSVRGLVASLKAAAGRDVTDLAADMPALKSALVIRNLSLDMPHIFAGRVHFTRVDLDASWLAATRNLLVSRLSVTGVPFRMAASGALGFAGPASPAVDFSGSVGTLGVRDFLRYWPVIAAPGGRSWVDRNMPSGEVGPFSFDIHLKAGDFDKPVLPADAVDVRFLLTNMAANYLEGMPHLTGIYGRAHLTGRDFTIDVDRASDGPMTLSGGQFRIPDINDDSPVGEIAFTLAGKVPDLMTLLDSPPLGYPTRFGIRPNATGGHVVAETRLAVPLIKDVAVDKIQISVHAPTSNLEVRLTPKLDITGGDVLFEVDNKALHASGSAGLGGSAARLQLDWSERFAAKKNMPTTQVRFDGTLDQVARRSLDLMPAGILSGPAQVSGTLEGMRGAMRDGHIAVDLTPARLSYPQLNIVKAAGQPLHADLTLGFGKKSRLSQLDVALSGGRGQGHASFRFDPSGDLQAVDLPDFRYGPDNSFALQLTRRPGGDEIRLSGAALDLSGWLDREADAAADNASGSGGVAGKKASYDLQAALGRVVLRKGVILNALKLHYQLADDKITGFSLDGKLGKAKLQGTLKTGKTDRVLHLAGNDAGALFRGLIGFSSMRGGNFTANVTLPALTSADKNAPDFSGALEVKDFRIVHQPLLARLFTAGSLGGMINLMGGKGIAVDRFHSQFSARHQVVSIFDTQAVGPSVGVTAEGYVDLGKDAVALKGTLVPLYGLNSVLGNIPILGRVLTSKKGEGVFGISYEITGDTDTPSVSVNPLSVLAPGFLRRIFEGEIPKASEAPSNNPVKKPQTPAKAPAQTAIKPVPEKKNAAAVRKSAPAAKKTRDDAPSPKTGTATGM